MDLKFLFAFGLMVLLIITETLFRKVYDLVPYTFIDEAFHVPQAIKYCNGTFHEWDPKITTLPGLYLFSTATHRIFGLKTCTLYSLRFGNVILTCFMFIFFYRILRRLKVNQKGYSRRMIIWQAFNLSIFPVSYFFTFLYYTDTLSTLLVLIMMDLHLSSKKTYASLVGIVACVARQVNIVWVGYLLLASLSKSIIDCLAEPSLKRSMKQLRKKSGLSSVLWSFKIPTEHLIRIALRIIENIYSYIIVCCLFILFIAINKGIVVGDKSAHEAVINLPQILYFSGFYLFFAMPFNLVKFQPFVSFVSKNRILTAFCVAVFALVINYNTHVHPYLLADNRHLTFYLWNKLLSKEFIKYFLIPLYFFGLYCLYDNSEGTSYQFATWVAVTIALVPQKLLEFRYFIIPFYIFRFHVRNNDCRLLLAESILYFVVNAAVFYIFFTKQFLWPDFKEQQRIIW